MQFLVTDPFDELELATVVFAVAAATRVGAGLALGFAPCR